MARWVPTADDVARARVTGLARRVGVAGLDELRAHSLAEPERFWATVADDLGIAFATPPMRILDDAEGMADARWFVGGAINLASVCVDRFAGDPASASASATAVIAEAEDGSVRTLTFGELAAEVDVLARALGAAGIGRGDVVGLFVPMIAEAVVAAYAVAKVGAIVLPVFSGFAAPAIAARLADGGARLVIGADATWRRGRVAALLPTLRDALGDGVERVVVVARGLPGGGADAGHADPREVDYEAFVGPHRGAGPLAAAPTGAEDPVLLIYTSGTTGRPKGAVHVHGGFTVKIAAEAAYQTDVGPGDVLFWVTDMGWIMGPWAMVGAHANGAAMVLAEGAPDWPGPERVWSMVARHQVTCLGVSPTLIRALKTQGDEPVTAHDRSSLRVLASTGEPWNPDPWRWLFAVAGESKRPIVNLSGGTEVGACFLSCHPVEAIDECSLGGPSLGMAVDVWDPDGRSLRGTGQVGELVCTAPWPSMTRGVWGEGGRRRFLDGYFSTYPGVWRHGDWARADADGQWYLLGRSDEAMNVAGKRVGPAEVESVLVDHPAVAEAAAVGVPDELKGEAIWVAWTPVDPDGPDVSAELRRRVGAVLGRPFTPKRVVRVAALPRTRSAKILRRVVRAVAVGEDPGDLSAAQNPESVAALRAALATPGES